MNYGPFCSYGPTYDSTFSTISKNDSDLLLSTYGDDTAVHYAKRFVNFIPYICHRLTLHFKLYLCLLNVKELQSKSDLGKVLNKERNAKIFTDKVDVGLTFLKL